MSNDPELDRETEGVPEPGDVLAGKYRVERVIGVGGMGIVVAAMHVQLEERVALKFMKREALGPEANARFLREARASARIKSEHVVRVTDVGTLENGAPYMVMEYLEGDDLGEVVRRDGPLTVRDAAEYVLEACEALAEAHALGIVHRDLKPSNLFLARRPGGRPQVKVFDFGISKMTSGTPGAPRDAARTRTRAWLGSPLYMSPEQMRSARDVDARTDIWSLGAVLFELLTGHVPFDKDSLPELCAQVIYGEPTPVAELRPDVPAGLVAIVGRCLRKDPAERYLNVAELALGLLDFAPQRARSAAERVVATIEEAGLSRASNVPRVALDATLPVPLLVPARSSPLPAPPAPPPPRASAPEVLRVSGEPAATAVTQQGERASAKPRPEPSRPRRGVVAIAWLLLLAGVAGGYLYLNPARWAHLVAAVSAARTAPAVTPQPVVPVSIASGSASASTALPVVVPIETAAAPIARPADAGADAAAPRSSAAPDAGAHRVPGRHEAPEAHDTQPSHIASPSGPPPEIAIEACSEIGPDGTRRQIPCR